MVRGFSTKRNNKLWKNDWLCLKEIIVAIMKRNLVAQIKFNSFCFSIDNIEQYDLSLYCSFIHFACFLFQLGLQIESYPILTAKKVILYQSATQTFFALTGKMTLLVTTMMVFFVGSIHSVDYGAYNRYHQGKRLLCFNWSPFNKIFW